jgi:hypothetical protein
VRTEDVSAQTMMSDHTSLGTRFVPPPRSTHQVAAQSAVTSPVPVQSSQPAYVNRQYALRRIRRRLDRVRTQGYGGRRFYNRPHISSQSQQSLPACEQSAANVIDLPISHADVSVLDARFMPVNQHHQNTRGFQSDGLPKIPTPSPITSPFPTRGPEDDTYDVLVPVPDVSGDSTGDSRSGHLVQPLERKRPRVIMGNDPGVLSVNANPLRTQQVRGREARLMPATSTVSSSAAGDIPSLVQPLSIAVSIGQTMCTSQCQYQPASTPLLPALFQRGYGVGLDTQSVYCTDPNLWLGCGTAADQGSNLYYDVGKRSHNIDCSPHEQHAKLQESAMSQLLRRQAADKRADDQRMVTDMLLQASIVTTSLALPTLARPIDVTIDARNSDGIQRRQPPQVAGMSRFVMPDMVTSTTSGLSMSVPRSVLLPTVTVNSATAPVMSAMVAKDASMSLWQQYCQNVDTDVHPGVPQTVYKLVKTRESAIHLSSEEIAEDAALNETESGQYPTWLMTYAIAKTIECLRNGGVLDVSAERTQLVVKPQVADKKSNTICTISPHAIVDVDLHMVDDEQFALKHIFALSTTSPAAVTDAAVAQGLTEPVPVIVSRIMDIMQLHPEFTFEQMANFVSGMASPFNQFYYYTILNALWCNCQRAASIDEQSIVMRTVTGRSPVAVTVEVTSSESNGAVPAILDPMFSLDDDDFTPANATIAQPNPAVDTDSCLNSAVPSTSRCLPLSVRLTPKNKRKSSQREEWLELNPSELEGLSPTQRKRVMDKYYKRKKRAGIRNTKIRRSPNVEGSSTDDE